MLWVGVTKDIEFVHRIYEHINSLEYADCPDYNLIHDNLIDIYNKFEIQVFPDVSG